MQYVLSTALRKRLFRRPEAVLVWGCGRTHQTGKAPGWPHPQTGLILVQRRLRATVGLASVASASTPSFCRLRYVLQATKAGRPGLVLVSVSDYSRTAEYSAVREFSRRIIFAVFADWSRTAKIKLAKYVH